jgi:rSAM/selenodomain-associated transferase 1
MADQRDLIIVFTKPATPGDVKTRLVPALSPDQAAQFHLAALADVISIAKAVRDQVELHVAGDEDDAGEIRALYPDHEVRQQGEGDLGERMSQAFGDAFERGFDNVAIVGSDHPTLPPEFLLASFVHLGHANVVFGPSEDGGYYSVAVRSSSWPDARAAFFNIPWSSSDVLTRTLERCRRAELSVALAPGWYDVDRPEDLRLVGRDAPQDSAALRYLKELWYRSGGSSA